MRTAGARILGRAADRPRIGLRQVLRRGEPREDTARPGGQPIAQDGGVLGQHDVELGDELPLVVLAVGQEPGAPPRELAQARDLLVGYVTGRGHPRPQQARDDVSIEVIRLGLAADDVPVAPGLPRIQHQDAVPGPAERRFQVFPAVARGLQPDQGLRRRRVASVPNCTRPGPPTSVLRASLKQIEQNLSLEDQDRGLELLDGLALEGCRIEDGLHPRCQRVAPVGE